MSHEYSAVRGSSLWWLDWTDGRTLDGVQIRADFYWGWNVAIYVDLPRVTDGKLTWEKQWSRHPDSMLRPKNPNGTPYDNSEKANRQYAEYLRLSRIHSMVLMEKLKNTVLDFERWPETIRMRKLLEDYCHGRRLTARKQCARLHL